MVPKRAACGQSVATPGRGLGRVMEEAGESWRPSLHHLLVYASTNPLLTNTFKVDEDQISLPVDSIVLCSEPPQAFFFLHHFVQSLSTA